MKTLKKIQTFLRSDKVLFLVVPAFVVMLLIVAWFMLTVQIPNEEENNKQSKDEMYIKKCCIKHSSYNVPRMEHQSYYTCRKNCSEQN